MATTNDHAGMTRKQIAFAAYVNDEPLKLVYDPMDIMTAERFAEYIDSIPESELSDWKLKWLAC